MNDEETTAQTRKDTVIQSGITSAAITADGSLWMWGDNIFGQIWNGISDWGAEHQENIIEGDWRIELFAYSEKTPIKAMDSVKSIFIDDCVLAIKENGELWGWGRVHDEVTLLTIKESTDIGSGYYYSYPMSPAKLMDDVLKAVSNGWTAMVIKTDGSLWGWGYGENGELGDGLGESSEQPIKIMDDVVQVDTGPVNTVALKSDGSLWIWGGNTYGQIGDGTMSKWERVFDEDLGEYYYEMTEPDNRYSPVKVMEGIKIPE